MAIDFTSNTTRRVLSTGHEERLVLDFIKALGVPDATAITAVRLTAEGGRVVFEYDHHAPAEPDPHPRSYLAIPPGG